MGLLNKYLFRNGAMTVGGLMIFACCILLMERMLRILQEVSSSSSPSQDITSMVVNLIPHFLGTAIPMALLLGIIITVDRFSRTSELTAALGSGISLFHMTKPFLIIAVILSAMTFYVEGYLMPKGRYEYRNVLYKVRIEAQAAALKQGTFVVVGNRTFFAGTNQDGDAKGPVFIHEHVMDGDKSAGWRVTTAEKGKVIIREASREVVIQLEDGQVYAVSADTVLEGNGSFDSSLVAGAADLPPFRIRGQDEREMTTTELFLNQNGSLNEKVQPDQNNATLHARLAKTLALLILPFIAVPFGLNYGRNPSSAGIFVGIIFVIALLKGLEFAESLGAKGVIPPWLGIWSIVLAVAGLAVLLFYKSAAKMGQPPMTAFTYWTKDAFAWLKKDLKETGQTLAGKKAS